MRGKLLYLGILLAAVCCLSSCVQVMNGPADELRTYRWRSELENSNTALLYFDDTNGYLSVTSEDFTLDIGGLCILSSDRLVICDEESNFNYSFGYQLYGDRVELSCNGSVLSLKKLDEEQ